jgi:hypothetical protein
MGYSLFNVSIKSFHYKTEFNVWRMLRGRRQQDDALRIGGAAAEVAREFDLGLLVTECVAPEFRDCAPATVEKKSNAMREVVTVAHG